MDGLSVFNFHQIADFNLFVMCIKSLLIYLGLQLIEWKWKDLHTTIFFYRYLLKIMTLNY